MQRGMFRESSWVTAAAVLFVLASAPAQAPAACSGGPELFVCLQESDYLNKLAELGYTTFQESFEDDLAWGWVRSSVTVINSAPSITSSGVVWTSNHPQTNEITTGAGAARTGLWGVYDPDHGSATGTPAACDIDNPPASCLYHDGFSGTPRVMVRCTASAALSAASSAQTSPSSWTAPGRSEWAS